MDHRHSYWRISRTQIPDRSSEPTDRMYSPTTLWARLTQSVMYTHLTMAVRKFWREAIWILQHVETWLMRRVITSPSRSHSMPTGMYPAFRQSRTAVPKVCPFQPICTTIHANALKVTDKQTTPQLSMPPSSQTPTAKSHTSPTASTSSQTPSTSHPEAAS